VLTDKALEPMATLEAPLVLAAKALAPTAVLVDTAPPPLPTVRPFIVPAVVSPLSVGVVNVTLDAIFAVVTVPSLGVPIANGAVHTTSMLLVPVGGAVLNVSVVPETEYVSFS